VIRHEIMIDLKKFSEFMIMDITKIIRRPVQESPLC